MHQVANAPAPRNQQHVKPGAGGEVHIGQHPHAAAGADHVLALGDQQLLNRRIALPPRLLIQASGGKDLEGPAKVQYLHVGIDQDADRLFRGV